MRQQSFSSVFRCQLKKNTPQQHSNTLVFPSISNELLLFRVRNFLDTLSSCHASFFLLASNLFMMKRQSSMTYGKFFNDWFSYRKINDQNHGFFLGNNRASNFLARKQTIQVWQQKCQQSSINKIPGTTKNCIECKEIQTQ